MIIVDDYIGMRYPFMATVNENAPKIAKAIVVVKSIFIYSINIFLVRLT